MKTYISDYPNITSTIKRYVELEKVTFLHKAHNTEDVTILLFYIRHEDNNLNPITNLDAIIDLVADNNTQVYSLTGEYLEYDNTTFPPTLLHTATKGQPIGEFDFFQNLKKVSTIVDNVVSFAITRADSLGRLNKYIKQ